ncbi:hypothetical protein VSR34_38080, partial [Paraburkholderia sp. JHI2823]
TTRLISSRNSRLRVRFVERSKPRPSCVIEELLWFALFQDRTTKLQRQDFCRPSLGISKRGDTYLRTLLIHGARSVLRHARSPSAWLEDIRKRRPSNVVTVALANKIARTIWAILAHGQPYRRDHVSVKPD